MNKKLFSCIAVILCSLIALPVQQVGAILTIPNSIMYQGVLFDNAGDPITTPQEIRFSIWSDSDVDSGDFNGDKTINTASAGYQSFLEEHVITPNSRGIFDVEIGTKDTLPNFTSTVHLYLQVELKPQGAPDSSYEVLDPDGDLTNTDDRKPIRSAPYASNADTIDNREIGDVTGDIAILGPNNQWLVSQIPDGTNETSFTLDDDNVGAGVPIQIIANQGSGLDGIIQYNPVTGTWQISTDDGATYNNILLDNFVGTSGDSFTIDNDDSSATPTLSFGTTANSFIQFDIANDWFLLGNDLNFDGNQAMNLVTHRGDTFPATPVEGQQFYRDDLDTFYIYDGTMWVAIGGAGGSNADTLDSLDSTQFLRSDASDTYTSGTLDFAAGTTLEASDATVTLNGIDNDTFTLDENADALTVSLEFGGGSAEYLSFDSTNDRFAFTNDLLVDGNISQNGTQFILDQDNTGSGNTVEIIANQGAEDDGILRYNTVTDRWELANDGSTFTSIMGSGTPDTLTNKVIDGDDNTLQDIDFSSLKTREKQLVLTAEYGGFTLIPDGSDNLGTMISDYIDLGGLDKYLYYRWYTRKTTLQDMDIVVKMALPSDFESFTSTPIEIQYRTATANLADNRIDVSVSDSTGAAVGIAGGSALTSTTFADAPITFTGTPTFTADGMMVIRVKVAASVNNYADVGDIVIHYNGR